MMPIRPAQQPYHFNINVYIGSIARIYRTISFARFTAFWIVCMPAYLYFGECLFVAQQGDTSRPMKHGPACDSARPE
jgi:hypothetical protein